MANEARTRKGLGFQPSHRRQQKFVFLLPLSHLSIIARLLV